MKKKAIKLAMVAVGRYLIHNSGCELELVSDALTTQKEFVDEVIRMVCDHDTDWEAMTCHILTVTKAGKMDISDFSSRFMNAITELADDKELTDERKEILGL